MITEQEAQRIEVEKERMRYVMAAANPQLYQYLFGREDAEEEGVVWTTPQTPEEVDELLTLISEQQVGVENPT